MCKRMPKEWKMCGNEVHGKLFKAYNAAIKQMLHRCGNNEEIPYINRICDGLINSRTRYEFGLLSDDMSMFKGAVMFR